MNMPSVDSSNGASESSKQQGSSARQPLHPNPEPACHPREPVCIVITGASSGLGAGLAHAYATPGRVLGLIGRNASRLADVAEACRQRGAAVKTGVLDVADAAAVSAWLLALDAESPVGLLIANAGVSSGTRSDGSSEGLDAACETVRSNLLGVIHSVESLLPGMLQRGGGQIAVVASMAAYRGLPDSPAYCASKAGVLAYGESLRAALEPRGVRVSVIVPGFFASPMSVRYGGQKLFLLSEAQAVATVVSGLRRKARRIVFPRQLALLLRLADLLPAWCGDRIMRAFRFHIAARPDCSQAGRPSLTAAAAGQQIPAAMPERLPDPRTLA